MQYIFLPFRVIFKVYYLIVFALCIMLAYPLVYFLLKDKSRFPKAFKFMRIQAYLLLGLAGAILRVKGKENIPKTGAYIIAPNHSSYLDIFCLYVIFRRYFVFIGKKEIEKWPLFHLYYTSGMNILVDRSANTSALGAMKRMSHEVEMGHPLVIFPEGTISKEAPNLAPFKAGAFAIAIQKQVPVLPVTFVTNWKLLSRSGFWKGPAGPGIAEVVIHEPIETLGMKKTDMDELQEKVRKAIHSSIRQR